MITVDICDSDATIETSKHINGEGYPFNILRLRTSGATVNTFIYNEQQLDNLIQALESMREHLK